jgi:hypothetical protein
VQNFTAEVTYFCSEKNNQIIFCSEKNNQIIFAQKKIIRSFSDRFTIDLPTQISLQRGEETSKLFFTEKNSFKNTFSPKLSPE